MISGIYLTSFKVVLVDIYLHIDIYIYIVTLYFMSQYFSTSWVWNPRFNSFLNVFLRSPGMRQNNDTKSRRIQLQTINIHHHPYQWIGLREILQENPILNGKIYGFL